WSPNQSLIAVFGRKLAHVKTSVRGFIPEQQLCNRFRQLCLSHASRTGKKCNAARASTTGAPLRKTANSSFYNIEHLSNRMSLSLPARAHKASGIAKFSPVHFPPWIFRYPKLDPPDGFFDFRECQPLTAAQLNYRRHIGYQQPLRGFDKRASAIFD